MRNLPIDKLLRPRSIALVGASAREHAAGSRILRNIMTPPFPGAVYPVNPRYQELQNLRCYGSLRDLPEVPDAVFIAIAAEDALSVLEEAGQLGIDAALINGTGFADAGPDGAKRQERLVAIARTYGMAVCGPNNSGFINLWDGIYPSTYYTMPRPEPGPVAVITQSGSVAIALSQDDRRLGLGYIITAGNEAVCGVPDYLDFVLRDDRIEIAMMFLEVIREPARFAEVAREAARRGKRIVVTKVGRTDGGRAAVVAHSGALAGDDAVYTAFFRRHGVIRAADLDEMIETAALFSACPDPPAEENVAVVTLSGGEAGLIADLGPERGLRTSPFSPETVERLKPLLSPYLTPRNPLDAMGLGWSRERFAEILRALLADEGTGTVAFAADASGGGLGDAELVRDMAEVCSAEPLPAGKRVVFFTNTAAGGPNGEVEAILKRAGIPILCGMRSAIGALANWANYRVPDGEPAAAEKVALRSAAARALTLPEPDRFQLLTDAGIPMADCIAAESADAAVAAAERFGYPVVLKGTAPDLPHKTELGLLRLGLTTGQQVREAFESLKAGLRAHSKAGHAAAVVVQPMVAGGLELIVGLRNDPDFGSVVIAGLGGTFVEVLEEASVRMSPVGFDQACEMLRETRAARLLEGFRGRGPYDLEAAARAIAALSRFGHAAQGILASVEVNPIIVRERGQGVLGVDVLIEPVSATAPD